jgi:hypothetical protein
MAVGTVYDGDVEGGSPAEVAQERAFEAEQVQEQVSRATAQQQQATHMQQCALW